MKLNCVAEHAVFQYAVDSCCHKSGRLLKFCANMSSLDNATGTVANRFLLQPLKAGLLCVQEEMERERKRKEEEERQREADEEKKRKEDEERKQKEEEEKRLFVVFFC